MPGETNYDTSVLRLQDLDGQYQQPKHKPLSPTTSPSRTSSGSSKLLPLLTSRAAASSPRT